MTPACYAAALTAIFGCGVTRDRSSAKLEYSPAVDELRRVTRNASGEEDVSRVIGTLADGEDRLQLVADSKAKVWMVIDRADTVVLPSVGVISAKPLRAWLSKAEQWLANPGATRDGSSVTEKLGLSPIELEDDGFYSLELTRELGKPEIEYTITATARGGTAHFRSVPSVTVSGLLVGLRAAADTAMAMTPRGKPR